MEPNVYLVMEYMAGSSLRALIGERGPLLVEEAVHIAADVCEGLAAAHAKGIIGLIHASHLHKPLKKPLK